MSLILLVSACTSPDKGTTTLLEFVNSDDTGIDFRNDIAEDLNNNVFAYTNFYNGGGVAVGDINNDGLADIYLSANNNTGKLYLNKGGFKFKDITFGSGMDTLSGWKTGVTMVDINQDGFLDIHICRSGRTRPKLRGNLLFVNNGDLTFAEKGKEYGLDDWGTSNQATFFDYDLDGDLDMYLLNHAIDPVRTIFKNFHDQDINRNTGDKLFKNTDGYFTEVKEFVGINRSKLGDGLGVAVVDLNNDRYSDIYICNDFAGRDYLYFNKGDGTFKEDALNAMSHMTISSMGVDMADIDNDGWLDIFVLDMLSSTNYGRKTNMSGMDANVFDILVNLGGHYQYMVNTLQLNNGNQTFSDIAPMAG
ncbi:MAG: VCBS repeat-containing protein, partial [Cyclobacteriaceae bacterium]|nr:VCBS repeat-containing protein [Cyclobacteriaceae bacterium]